MNNKVTDGMTWTTTAPYALASGDGCLVGSRFGVAKGSAASGATVVLELSGVFTLTKTTGQAWTAGAKIYWDNTNRRCTTTATGNTLIGWAAAPAASADTTGLVGLGGVV